ncbi:MAG: hypothetical protein DWQ09_03475 [Proteobacteria bacterium]|nr:MAG: hypothetical protein DWQ09_03475 [Pseudomonadota bacterium]QKK11069.1 MAG: hypothetical protein HND59_05110 [Pseudomonadota bacterium]
MKVLARLGVLTLFMVFAASWAAKPAGTDIDKVGRDLWRHAYELREIGKAMQMHASTKMPAGLNQKERTSVAATQRELQANADAARALASRLEGLARKAQGGTLKRTDMERLGAETKVLNERINKRRVAAKVKRLDRSELNNAIKEVESIKETVRNNRQMATTAFQNFDQKSNQLYNLLSSIMKALNEMRMGTVRNML